jgi:hypothetical protein
MIISILYLKNISKTRTATKPKSPIEANLYGTFCVKTENMLAAILSNSASTIATKAIT